MPQFKCWLLDDGDEDSAELVEADTAEDAAEEFFECVHDGDGEIESGVVFVIAPDGVKTSWDTCVEFFPSYTATQRT